MDKKGRHRIAILDALAKSSVPTTSARLAEMLADYHPLSDRTIRLYLKELDEEGLTAFQGRRRRVITEHGLAELRAAHLVQRVGYLSAKIDQMTYSMSFDLTTRTGDVVVNTSIVDPTHLASNADKVCKVFADGYAMGNRVALLAPGEVVGDLTVPENRIGFCTVCSITINGVLLKYGVPTTSRFGGVLEVRNHRATRFVEMIHYDGTSVDPLEVFIRSGMTNYCGAIQNGNGLIGASFREMPEDSRDLVLNLSDQLSTIGLGAFMEVGQPGQPLLGLPVSPGRVGSVVAGGLNPIAILEEMGQRVYSRALSGLLDYNRLIPADDLPRVLKVHL